jgi:hypothetical protein
MSQTLRIVRGEPTAEELAVVTALMTAAGDTDEPEPSQPVRGRWNDPATMLATPGAWHPGPGAWRAAAR